MMTTFGSKAPGQCALDAIHKARTGQQGAQGGTPCARPDTAAIRLDAGVIDQWPARDQFGRGTCVAFATLAAVELHRALRDDLPPERLSEQFLHERMITAHPLTAREEAGIPEGGVLLHQALSALETDGVVGSEHAPYKPAHTGLGAARGEPAPSAAARALGHANRLTSHAYGTISTADGIHPCRVDRIEPGQDTAHKLLGFLQNGQAVAVGVPLFQHVSGTANWLLPQAIRNGIVHCPEDAGAVPLEGPRADGHVVCLTGFEPDPSEPLGGWFVFRNSWGLEFASHAPINTCGLTAGIRGYGLMSATHLNSYCWEYLVPAPPRAKTAA